MRLLPLVLLVSVLPACTGEASTVGFAGGSVGSACASDGASLAAGFEADLTPDGCTALIDAANSDDTTRLILDVPAFATMLSDGTADATYTLPDTDVRLSVEVGCAVDAEYCTDAFDEQPVVDATYTPTAGTITVHAVRDEASGGDDDGYSGTATVTFEGVVFADDSGESVPMGTVTWDVLLYTPLLG